MRWIAPRKSFFLTLCFLFPALALAQAEREEKPGLEKLERPEFLPAEPQVPFELPPVDPEIPVAPAHPELKEPLGILSIRFLGNTAIPSAELDQITAAYKGRVVAPGDLELLRVALTRKYVDQGYVNSGVMFGEPVYEAGVLNFQVIEGRLSEVRVQGAGRLDPRYLRDRLVRDGQPLNVNVLRERFQLLLDDPHFENLNARLRPGGALGEAVLDIEVERTRPYQLTAFYNNKRSPSIGARTWGFRGWVRNLAGRGDLLEATVQDAPGNDPGNTGDSFSLGYEVPLNYRGTKLRLGLDKGDSAVLERPVVALDVQSVLGSREAGISHTFIDTLQHNLTLGVDYTYRVNRTTLGGAPFSFIPNEPTGTTKVRAWRWWQEYVYRTQEQVVALRSTYVNSSNNLKDTPAFPTTARYPESEYQFWIGQAQYARQFPEQGLQLNLRGNIQRTHDRLLSLDGLSIGGHGTVRGYRENQLIRDNGYILNAELEWPVPFLKPDFGSLTLVPFYDWGRGWQTGEASSLLTSWGLAMRYRFYGLHLDLTLAKRLDHPVSVDRGDADIQDDGIQFEISYDFFND